jgi:hypothetical protein
MSDITKAPGAHDQAESADWHDTLASIQVGDLDATEAATDATGMDLADDAAPDATALAPVARTSMSDWFRARTPDQWFFFGMFILAAVLRFWGLADKPLHHDESLHAYYSWQFLLNPANYQYNPLLHGPFQFHVIPCSQGNM